MQLPSTASSFSEPDIIPNILHSFCSDRARFLGPAIEHSIDVISVVENIESFFSYRLEFFDDALSKKLLQRTFACEEVKEGGLKVGGR